MSHNKPPESLTLKTQCREPQHLLSAVGWCSKHVYQTNANYLMPKQMRIYVKIVTRWVESMSWSEGCRLDSIHMSTCPQVA